METSCEIKKLGKNDQLLAKQLLEEWYKDDGQLNPSFPKEKYLSSLLNKEDFHAFVAVVNNLVVGGLTAYELPMFDVEANEMFLYEIGVSKAYRQKGIAKKLIEALREVCFSKEIKVIFVGTSMDNEVAKKLYETTGAEIEIIPWFTYNLK
ncbi:MAG: GNAT family N-acetyltransferase [Bacteroidota bacterium]